MGSCASSTVRAVVGNPQNRSVFNQQGLDFRLSQDTNCPHAKPVGNGNKSQQTVQKVRVTNRLEALHGIRMDLGAARRK